MQLHEAVTAYLHGLENGREESRQLLLKFMRWFGRTRLMDKLTPPEIGHYAEQETLGNDDGPRRLLAIREFLVHSKKIGLIQTNLAVHLRARRSGRAGKARRIDQNAGDGMVRLTAQGLAEKVQRLEEFRSQLPRVTEEIKRAAADKDVRENAPLEAARQQHGLIMARIRELEDTISKAKVLEQNEEKGGRKLVRQGSVVTLKDIDSGEDQTWQLVDPREANSLGGKMSIASPVGNAMQNRGIGDKFQVDVPKGSLTYQILNVE